MLVLEWYSEIHNNHILYSLLRDIQMVGQHRQHSILVLVHLWDDRPNLHMLPHRNFHKVRHLHIHNLLEEFHKLHNTQLVIILYRLINRK